MKVRTKLFAALQVVLAVGVIWLMFSSDPVRNRTLLALRGVMFSAVWDGWYGSKAEWKGLTLEVPRGRYWWGAADAEQLSLHTRNPEVAGIVTVRANKLSDDYLSLMKRRCEQRQCSVLSERRVQIGATEAELLEFESSSEDGEHLRYAFLTSPNSDVVIETVSRPKAFAGDLAVAQSLLTQAAQGRSQR